MELIVTTSISLATSIGVFLFFAKLLKKYLITTIESAVQHEYSLKLEQYKIEHEKRMKAQLIAELLSEWNAVPSDKKSLNRLTFEAFIWLPEDIAAKLSATLSHTPGAPHAKELIIEVRRLLHEKDDSIEANSVIHFP